MAARKTQKQNDFDIDLPIMTPEEWENRLIAKSFKAVEARIDNGTATAAEYVHFLKAGSARQREEMEKLKEENALLRAKTAALDSARERAEFYGEVLKALSSYRTETQDEPLDPYIY